MRNLFTVDGIFKKERQNCLQGQKWTIVVKMCYSNSAIIYLPGKWPMNPQWKTCIVRELGHKTRVSVLTGQSLINAMNLRFQRLFEIWSQGVPEKYRKV